MIGQQQQRRPYFKAIPPDAELQKLKKDSWAYRHRQKTRRCCICSETATMLLVQELEGYKRIEKYCETCGLKTKQDILSNRQSMSGI